MSKPKHRHVMMPIEIQKGLSKDYIEMMEVARIGFEKNPEKHMKESNAAMGNTSPYAMALPHPIRRKMSMPAPLAMELGVAHNYQASMYCLASMAQKQIKVPMMIYDLLDLCPEFADVLRGLSSDPSGENFGQIETIMMPHRYMAKGSNFIEVTPMLAKKLSNMTCSETLCEHLNPPFNVQFIACDSNIEIHNQQSGMHRLEGCYINKYVIPAEIARDNKDTDHKDPRTFGSMSWYGYKTGYLTADGGEIIVLDFMATGSPVGKRNVLDDATFSFGLLIQDKTKTVAEVIAFHTEYYQNINKIKAAAGESGKLSDIKKEVPMGTQSSLQFVDVIELMTKVLIYIDGDISTATRTLEATNLTRQIKNSLSKVKAKKLTRERLMVADKYIIDSSSNPDIAKRQQSRGQIWNFLGD